MKILNITKQPLEWRTVALDGLPKCDNFTLYIGINEFDFVGVFNDIKWVGTPIKRPRCIQDTPDEDFHIMDDLKYWARLDEEPDTFVGWRGYKYDR